MTTTTDNLKRLSRQYMNGLKDEWRNINFSDAGAMRLAHIAGFVTALDAAGKHDLAEKMAHDICYSLDYLSEYGGLDTQPMGKGAGAIMIEAPRYRVQLHDDGTFGGFSIGWYCRLPFDYEGDKDVKSLELWRYGRPADVKDGQVAGRAVKYAYSFNGGLLYHGPGGDETFAVDLNSSRLWSIHT